MPKRLLWIGQTVVHADAGDVLYDRKLIAACQALDVEVDRVQVSAVSRLSELAALARGRPYYRARFESDENREAIVRAAAGHAFAVCSWESLDSLAYACPIPTIPILHNVTSQAARSIFPSNMLARLVSERAAMHERKLYRSQRFPAIAVLSEADHRLVRRIAPDARVVIAAPGMPPCLPLPEHAPVLPELMISGSFAWFPKRRDVIRFAEEYARQPAMLDVIADQLPPRAATLLKAKPMHSEATPAIRFGLISDRFSSGFKLKTTSYLAHNAIVLSFAPIPEELRALEDSALFLRELRQAADIAEHVAAIKSMDTPELRQRFVAFKARCAARFSWRAAAESLLAAFAAPHATAVEPAVRSSRSFSG